jgi:hypothetical protein
VSDPGLRVKKCHNPHTSGVYSMKPEDWLLGYTDECDSEQDKQQRSAEQGRI